MNKGITVLSLFDGMSCGQIALERAGIPVSSYFASEIDKYAIKVTNVNYPNTLHIGSVTNLNLIDGYLCNNENNYPVGGIDLLIGGSPCQGFSFSGHQKGMVTKDNIEITSLDQYLDLKNSSFEFQGESFLFWEYIRLLKECSPKYFLLENVKMSKKWENLITSIIGVEPIVINSALVSAQNRQRLYWTNITGITQPEDKGILLKDIIESGQVDRDKSLTVTTRINGATAKRYLGKSMHQMIIERNTGGLHSYNGKGSTLTTMGGGHREPKVQEFEGLFYRKLTPEECEKLQTVPVGYTDHVSNSQRYKMLGNGWTVDVISHIFSGLKTII